MLVEHCRRLVGHDERFVYAYYPGVDTVAHEFGLHDEYYLAELAFADELVGRLLDALPSHATLVVTADHGQVHVGDNWVPLHPLREMFKYCAGEGRFRYLYANKGAASRAARSRARRVRGPGLGVLARPAARRGMARPGPRSSPRSAAGSAT